MGRISKKTYRIFQINMRMQVASLLLLSAVVAQADQSSYPSTYNTHHHYSQDNLAPYSDYDDYDKTGNFLEEGFGFLEKQGGLDLDTVLSIAVFGGLGIGALAWIDSINHRNKLCNKLHEITKIARGTTSAGSTAVALSSTVTTVTGWATANTVINSNREFINSLAAIADLAC